MGGEEGGEVRGREVDGGEGEGVEVWEVGEEG